MIKQSILSFLGLVLLLVSCQKDSQLEVDQLEGVAADVTELAYTQHLATDVEETADEATIAPPPPGMESLKDCADISAEQDKGVFPNTITIDFGDGCSGRDGKERSGKVIVEISDSLHNPGAIRTVTFEDYFVDGVQISGSKSWENLGIDENGLLSVAKIANLTFTFPDGTSSSLNSERTVTKSTQFVKYRDAGKWKKRIVRFKGTVEVSGSATGTNREGISFSAVIIEPLVKNQNCLWFGSGIVELTRDDQTRILDYGDGACNNAAMVTFDDGTSKEINIKPFWKRGK